MNIGSYKTSGEKTSDVAICDSPGYLGGVLVITDGSNDATVILYDDPDSANGDKLWECVVTGSDNYGGAMFALPIRADSGIWLDIEGTGASCIVYYQKQDLG